MEENFELASRRCGAVIHPGAHAPWALQLSLGKGLHIRAFERGIIASCSAIYACLAAAGIGRSRLDGVLSRAGCVNSVVVSGIASEPPNGTGLLFTFSPALPLTNFREALSWRDGPVDDLTYGC